MQFPRKLRFYSCELSQQLVRRIYAPLVLLAWPATVPVVHYRAFMFGLHCGVPSLAARAEFSRGLRRQLPSRAPAGDLVRPRIAELLVVVPNAAVGLVHVTATRSGRIHVARSAADMVVKHTLLPLVHLALLNVRFVLHLARVAPVVLWVELVAAVAAGR